MRRRTLSSRAKPLSLDRRCTLLALVPVPTCSVSAAPPLRKKNSSLVTVVTVDVAAEVDVAEVTGLPTPAVEQLDRRPLAKVAEREALELSATRMISPPFERALGLSCPLLRKVLGVYRGHSMK